MIFSISAFTPWNFQFRSSAAMAMVVSMHVASEVQNKSVGENRSPFPLLSNGASVSILVRLWL